MMLRNSGYFFTIVWFILFLYDITYGLSVFMHDVTFDSHEIRPLIYLLVFIATGSLAYHFKPELNKISQLFWIIILTWVIFVFYGLLITEIDNYTGETVDSIFIVMPYITWASLFTSILVSIVLAPVSYFLLKKQSVIVNTASSLLAATYIFYLYQQDNTYPDLYPFIEGAFMVLLISGMTLLINWYALKSSFAHKRETRQFK